MSQSLMTQWLETQCRLLPNVMASAVCSPATTTEPLIAVVYPQNSDEHSALQAAADLASKHNKPIIYVADKNATSVVTIAHPVKLKNDLMGAAVFILEDCDTNIAKSSMTQLQQGLPWLTGMLNFRCDDSPLQVKLGKLTRLIGTVLTPESFTEATTALASELSSELNCERVFLGMVHSRRTRLECISKTSDIAPKGALTQAVTAAMDEANDQQRTISSPRIENATAPFASIRQDELRNQHQFGAICTVPLIIDGRVIGSLLLERSKDNSFNADDLVLFEQIGSFIAPILKLKYRTGVPLLSRFREKASRWKRWSLSDKNISWKLASVVFVMTMTGVSLLPVAYEVTTTSRLEGSIQRSIPAPDNGFIKSVFARPGDEVKTNQLLIELDDRDLQLQREKSENEIAKLKSSFGKALATSDRSKLAVIQAEIAEAKADLSYVKQQLQRTRLISPFDGIVLEGDLTQSLGAPIQQGDNLMVLSPSNDFRIILEAEQQDIEKITIGQSGRIAFSSNPSQYFNITVNRISPVAKTLNGKNIFEIEAAFSQDYSVHLRPGFEGLAKLYVDDRPLFKIGYQKAHNWIKFHVWRWTGMV